MNNYKIYLIKIVFLRNALNHRSVEDKSKLTPLILIQVQYHLNVKILQSHN